MYRRPQLTLGCSDRDLAYQHNLQVHHIRSRRPGHHQVAHISQQWVRVVAVERVPDIEVAGGGAADRAAIDQRTGGIGGSVDAIRALAAETGPEVIAALFADVGSLVPAPRGGDEKRIWVSASLVSTGGRVLLRAAADPAAISRLSP